MGIFGAYSKKGTHRQIRTPRTKLAHIQVHQRGHRAPQDAGWWGDFSGRYSLISQLCLFARASENGTHRLLRTQTCVIRHKFNMMLFSYAKTFAFISASSYIKDGSPGLNPRNHASWWYDVHEPVAYGPYEDPPHACSWWYDVHDPVARKTIYDDRLGVTNFTQITDK